MNILSEAYEQFLEILTDFLPMKRIDGKAGQPYLERAFLFKLFGVTAYIHRFVDSDPDRGLHDHPWGWGFSIVLRGRYLERYLDGDQTKERWIRWFNWIPGYRFHRVIMRSENGEFVPAGQFKPVWTLFIHGPRVKEWGFMDIESTGSGVVGYQYSFYNSYTKQNGPGWHKTAMPGRFIKRYRRKPK